MGLGIGEVLEKKLREPLSLFKPFFAQAIIERAVVGVSVGVPDQNKGLTQAAFPGTRLQPVAQKKVGNELIYFGCVRCVFSKSPGG